MSETIFLDYDQAGLDAQYNNREHVPDHMDHYAGWAAPCDQVVADFSHWLDAAYGDSPREALDIFAPDGDGPFPVHVYIHGGYWMSREKSDQRFLARPFVEAGAVFVLVEYDLMPNVRMADIVRQCRDAVAWVYDNAVDFKADPGRIYVSGHSAGGHLVAMLAETDWLAHADVSDSLIKGGCAISGIFDLTPIQRTYMQETLGLTDDEIAENSPLFFDPVPTVPLIVAAGGAETDEFRRQSIDFAENWNNRGGECTHMECDGSNHFTILNDLADPGSDLVQAIKEQMDLV